MDDFSLNNVTVEAPRQSLRKTYYVIFGMLILLVVAELALSLWGRRIDDQVFQSQQRRYLSYLVADELRQSSDDLTRMARMYAATGDPVYEQYYEDIIAIREGKMARPVGYDKIYWDLALVLGRHTAPSQRMVSLDQLFAAVGISDDERALLQQAKANSDSLMKRELTAMNAVKGLFPDSIGHFTLTGPPDRARAMSLLTDADYNRAKARIMKPLRDFQVLLDRRTQLDVNRKKSDDRLIARCEIAASVSLVLLMVLAFVLLNRRLIEPIQELTRAAMNLGRQGFSRRVESPNDDELGVLCRTLNQMSDSIEQQLSDQKASEVKFRGLIEAAPDALIISDEEGTIVLINKQAEALFGYSRDELIGQRVEILVPDPARERHPELRTEFHEDPARRHMGVGRELKARCKDGSELPVDITLSPIEIEGAPLLVCSSVRDVSGRRAAEQAITRQLAFQKAMLNTIPYPMFIKDAGARFVGCNQAYVDAFGVTPEFLNGKTVLELAYIPDEAREMFHAEDVEVIRTGARRSYELPITYRDQTEHVTLYTVDGFHMPDGSPGGLIGLMVDITDRKRAEEELHRSQQLVQAVMDNTSAIMFVKDENGRYVMVNRQWCETVKVSREDAIGSTDHEIFPKDMADAHVANDLLVRESGELHTAEESGEFEGQRHSFISTKFPLIDEDGNVFATAGVSTDVTEFKETQELIEKQRHLFQAIIDNAGAFIYVKDPAGRYLFVNRNYEELLGKPAAEILGKVSSELFDKATAAAYEKSDEDVRRTLRPIKSETETEVDGQRRHFLSHKFPLLDDAGKLFATAGVSSDITDLKRTLAELAQAKEAADSANEAKSAFLATMSHEIRTPMNAVINMTALALETDLNNKQRQYLSVVSSSARGLLALINDILDFSKIEAGRMDLEVASFDLRKLFEEVADSFRGRVLEKHIEFIIYTSPEVPTILKGDSLRLRQVLINLVGNAFKFTAEGEVALRVELLEDRLPEDDGDGGEATLAISVRDSGVGISADQISKLGESFTQADSSTARKFGGTGLGLAICKRLIEMMGGKLRIESEVGVGSVFSFSATFGYSMQDQPGDGKYPVGIAATKVLVVEDNGTSRELLKSLFESFGMSCTLAGTAEEGWEKIQAEDFGLAVVDWLLPGADGIAFAKQVRQNAPTAELPLIMVSSFAGKEEEAQAGHAGVNVFVPKPITASMLYDGVLKALKVTGRPAKHETRTDAADQSGFEGKRLLLAEDNEANQFVAEEILTRAGFKMDIANNGLEAVEMVKLREYDVVLMDMQMPGMDGLEATRTIRRELAGQPLPIIALTANAMQSDLEACRAAGMDDYVAKPIDRRLLFQVLGKWVLGKSPQGPGNKVVEPVVPDAMDPEPVESLEDASARPASVVAEAVPVEPAVETESEVSGMVDIQPEQNVVTPLEEGEPPTVVPEPEPAVPEDGVEATPPEAGKPVEPKPARKKRAKKKTKKQDLQPDLFGNLDELEDEAGPIVVRLDEEGVPTLPGVDFRDAMNRLGLPVDSIQKMILRFAGSLAQMFKELRESLDAKDDEAARRHAHSIAGAAGNLSADVLRRHAKTLELAIKFGQGGYEKMLADVETETARVMAGIQQFEALVEVTDKRESVVKNPGSPADVRRLQTVLEELIASLSEGDLEAIGQVAGRLKELPLPESIAADFDRLTELVDGFDYADAVELVKSMQGRFE